MLYWKLITFNLSDKDKMIEWKKKHEDIYQMRDVFINNMYGIEYRYLIRR